MAKEGAKVGGLVLLGSVVALVLAIAIASMWIFGWGFFQRSTADFRGKTEQIEKTKANADFRIAAYDHFYNLCAAVQSEEATIRALEKELKRGPSESRVEQIYASITANEATRAENINQYNADAKKEATIGQFKASDLPYELNVNAEETKCAY